MNKRMSKLFIQFRKLVAESKINIGRSMSYVAIINSGMILFLMLSKLQDYGIPIYITKWFIPIFILSIIAMIIVGYVDYRLGFHREEAMKSRARDPYFAEVLEKLEKIEEQLKK